MCNSIRSLIQLMARLFREEDDNFFKELDPELHLTGSVLDGTGIKSAFSVDVLFFLKGLSEDSVESETIMIGNRLLLI